MEWDFQIVAAVGVVAAALAVAVAAVVDITAHLGGTADRLTVNWHWRLIWVAMWETIGAIGVHAEISGTAIGAIGVPVVIVGIIILYKMGFRGGGGD